MVARLDDRAYLACAACATEIHCYQAVTDVEAVAPEPPPSRGRRSRHEAGKVAAKRRSWLSRLAPVNLEVVFPAPDGGKDLDRPGLGA